MPLTLPPLPFAANALEPFMSARTLELHHGKHHRAYIDATNAATKGTDLETVPLTAIVLAAKAQGNARLFNASAQAWNHEFFWNGLAPASPANPTGRLFDWLKRDFGSLEQFKGAFKAEAAGHFGSGWAWLVLREGHLSVASYHDADTPLVHEGVSPLLTVDVWEHAYYLDYQNARPAFVDAVLGHLINWTCVAERLDRAVEARGCEVSP